MTMGHEARSGPLTGLSNRRYFDIALQELLSSKLRGRDFAGRIGGDECSLLMPDASIDESISALERLRQAVEIYRWQPVPITVSLGVTSYLTGDTRESLITRADAAKHQGRNLVAKG
ncbi:GGDEF domain-containing protein [Halomonas sp. LS-001]